MHNDVKLDTGAVVSAEFVQRILDEELAKIHDAVGDESFDADRFAQARKLFTRVALADDYADFLTVPAYQIVADE